VERAGAALKWNGPARRWCGTGQRGAEVERASAALKWNGPARRWSGTGRPGA